MKRAIAFILISILLITLCACGAQNEPIDATTRCKNWIKETGLPENTIDVLRPLPGFNNIVYIAMDPKTTHAFDIYLSDGTHYGGIIYRDWSGIMSITTMEDDYKQRTRLY